MWHLLSILTQIIGGTLLVAALIIIVAVNIEMLSELFHPLEDEQ